MSATVGTLNIEVQLQLAKMQAQFDQLTTSVRAQNAKIKEEFKGLTDSVTGFFKDMVPAFTAGAIVEFSKSLIENAAQIQHSADAARMSAESFQEFNILAKESGVETQQLTRALDAMEKKIEDAATGVKGAAKPFADLGLNIKTLAGMSADKQFEAIAEAVAHAQDPAKAFADALDILGTKAGPKLLEVLKTLGTEGFDNLAGKSKAAGKILSDSVTAELDQIERKSQSFTTRFKNMFSNMAADIAAGMGNGVTDLTLQLDNAKESLANLRQSDPTNAEYIRRDVEEVQRLQAELDKATEAKKKLDAPFEAAAAAQVQRQAADAAALAMHTREAAEQTQYLADRIKNGLAAAAEAARERMSALVKATTDEWKAGQEMWVSTRSAAEKYHLELDKIAKLEKDGVISADTAARARSHAYQESIGVTQAELDKIAKATATAEASVTIDATNPKEQLKEINAEIEKTKTAVSELSSAEGDHQAAIAAGDATIKQLQQEYDATDKKIQQQAELKRKADELAKSLSSTFVDGVANGESFDKIVKGLVVDLAKAAMTAALVKPLESSMSTGVSSAISAIGIAGMLASGGPASQGNAYIVGEDGPEVFSPSTSGTVIPNSALGAMGGGGGDVNQHFQISSGVTRQEIAAIMPKMLQAAKAAVIDAARRGGPYSQVLGTA